MPRRLDQAPTATKPAVLARDAELAEQGIENREPVLGATSGAKLPQHSPLTFDRLIDDEDNVPANLRAWIEAFSPNARDAIEFAEMSNETAGELDGVSTDTRRPREHLGKQRELLVERRQALMTAAVTGEIEV